MRDDMAPKTNLVCRSTLEIAIESKPAKLHVY